MTVYNYAEQFLQPLNQKYAQEMTSYDLTQSNPQVQFLNAQTIKLPSITVSGYKDHNRQGAGFNTGTITNEWEPKKLAHDRDVEFAIDPMDVDETNLVVSIANVQNTLETEQAIPEKDSYRYSKLLAEAKTYKANGAHIDTTVLTSANILDWFDDEMERMDDAGVPTEGRVIYCTPKIRKLLKQAEGIQRTFDVQNTGTAINRNIYSLDDVKIKTVPSGRMKSKYDFSNGCVAAVDAKQINIILIHPSCVVSRDKYAYINVFSPGHDSRTADKYMLQSRFYMDLFLIKNKAVAVSINVETGGEA